MPDQTVRRRACVDCGHAWFTVEVAVPNDAVGWSALHQRRPVLRDAVTVAATATPLGYRRAAVSKCDNPGPGCAACGV